MVRVEPLLTHERHDEWQLFGGTSGAANEAEQLARKTNRKRPYQRIAPGGYSDAVAWVWSRLSWTVGAL